MKNRGAEVDHSTIQGWAVNRINCGIKASKLEGVNTLIIGLNKTT
jgi:hypothetical protein